MEIEIEREREREREREYHLLLLVSEVLHFMGVILVSSLRCDAWADPEPTGAGPECEMEG